MTAITWQQSAYHRVWVAGTPGGELLTVTNGQPHVLGSGRARHGRPDLWRGTPCPTRPEAVKLDDVHDSGTSLDHIWSDRVSVHLRLSRYQK